VGEELFPDSGFAVGVKEVEESDARIVGKSLI
jgi:hypothetical protein